ncbi:S8 family serine peptidase [Halovivax limisalsi]|uniref:S8 family serine peptidase n=1 Tax=Halovivax limisalsi TaxID=1453760 RepID=UPI001FFD4E07|nr:S8 family serine peptidase [Halovivax limisalsi]
MATGGTTNTANGEETESDSPLSVDEVQTQSGDDVTIDSALSQHASGGETIEVMVSMDAETSSFASAATEATQAALEREAAETQAPLETFASERSGVEVLNQFWIANVALIEVDTNRVALEELTTVEGVTGLYENFEVTADASEEGGLEFVGDGEDEPAPFDGETGLVSADAEEYTYGLEQIRAHEAWEQFNVTGDGASVAVLDTGLDADHPEFADFDAETNWAHFNESGMITGEPPSDSSGHGTHVAGTVLGGAENATHIGVAPDAELYAGAVIPGGSGSFAQILAGMQWAASEDVDVISMSLGATTYSTVFIDAIDTAHSMGSIVVASAGNSGEGSTGTPGNDYTSFSVGASNSNYGIATFSSGEKVEKATAYGYRAPAEWPDEYIVPDVAAPGVDVYSSVPGGGYSDAYSGTSMAAPHVSGTVALMRAANPDLTVSEIKETLEAEAMKPPSQYATDAATSIGDQDSRYGHGIIDAQAAVANVSNSGNAVTVTVEDASGTPMPDLPVEMVNNETGNGMVAFTDGNGQVVETFADGEYGFASTTFGYGMNVTMTEITSDTDLTLTLEDTVGAEVTTDQPDVVGSNSSFMVDTRVANLQEYSVNLTADSVDPVLIENVTVWNTTEASNPSVIATDVGLGQTVDVAGNENVTTFNGSLGVEVEVGAVTDSGPPVGLNHTFAGVGDPISVTTGPTETLGEASEANVSLDVQFQDAIDLDGTISPTMTVTNHGDETAQFTAVLQVANAETGGSAQLETITLEGGQSYEGTYPISGAGGLLGAGQAQQGIALYNMSGGLMTIETAPLLIRGAGPVAGTITDADGDPVEAAQVRLVDFTTGETVGQVTTDENGQYAIDVGDRSPTEWLMVVDHPQYGTKEITEASTADGSIQQLDAELAASTEYAFHVNANEPTAIGVPGVSDMTVGDMLPDDTNGVVWAFDATADEWTQASADDELEPLDAVVVVTENDSVAQVYFEGPAGDVETPTPGVGHLSEGWNFIAPSQQAHVGDVFDGSADPSAVLDVFADPESGMVHGEDLDRSAISLPGDSVENATVNPFSGYFVYANQNGSVPAYAYDGVTLSEANDLLNVSTTTIEGTVVGEHSGEPVEAATVGLKGTGLATYTDSDGEFTIEDVPTGTDHTVVTPDGVAYATDNTSASAGDTGVSLTPEETTYLTNESFTAPGTLNISEQFSIDVNVTNLGVETAEDAEFQLRIGENVTDPAADIMADNETFIVNATTATVESGETVTITFEETIRSFHPTGDQSLTVATPDVIAPVQNITIGEASTNVAGSSTGVAERYIPTLTPTDTVSLEAADG